MSLKVDSFKRIIESLHDGLFFVNRDRIITYWNKAAEQISGFTAEEVVGKSCADNILTHIDSEGNNICIATCCPLEATILDGQPREIQLYMHHKKGHRVPVSIRVTTLTDEDGNIIGGIELFTKINDPTINELRVKELEKLALLDGLTQLPNRNYIEREINSRLEQRKRYESAFGILFIDIDNFKIVNDFHGHFAGDDVLKYVANTFVANARPFDLYGRWGGEEFVAIIHNVDIEDLKLIGKRLLSLIESSYTIHEDKKLFITVSIGATLIRNDDTIDSLIKRADTLMYKSKTAGRNCITTD
ncbi:MAG: diguanylate cyclase [Candidatus Fermentibacteria bacterium]